MPEQNQVKRSRSGLQVMSPLQTMSVQRLLLVLLVGAGAGIAFYLAVTLATGVWQILVGAIGLIAGLAILGVASRRLRAGKTTQAGYLVLLAAGIAFGAPVGFWGGVTPLLIASGVLMIIFLADLLLPDQRWRAMLAGSVGFAAYCMLTDRKSVV